MCDCNGYIAVIWIGGIDMTFREKLAQEHPQQLNRTAMGGCDGCPCEYGYEKEYVCGGGSSIRCEMCWNREIPETPAPMTAEEAWKLAKKLFADFSESQLNEIFGEWWNFSKLMELSPYEAKAKIEEWESKRIRVGDVCKVFENSCVITQVDENEKQYVVIWDDGDTDKISFDATLKLTKTGKHIDIQAVLDQIGGGKDE